MSEIEDRRQRALEAGEDAGSYPYVTARTVEVAIEVATQVKVTHDIILAFVESPGDPDDAGVALEAAFRAAGFEVIK